MFKAVGACPNTHKDLNIVHKESDVGSSDRLSAFTMVMK